MKKSVWGPFIWTLLHCFSMRIKDEYFIEERPHILKYIGLICENLPCPTCSLHATQYLKKCNFRHIKTKEILIQVIYNLHNDVNKRTKKNEFNKEELKSTYDNHNFQKIIINYINMSNRINYGEKMMLYTFKRREFLKRFLEYFKENLHKYNNIIE